MKRVVCIGEAMVELAPAGPGLLRQAVAGDVFNTAVYLRRALPAAAGEVAFLTALGDDGFSEAIRREVRGRGLDDGACYPVPGGQPGLYIIELDAHGDRSFHYWRSASAARRWFAELEGRGGAEVLAGADLVHLSGISLAILEPDARAAALDMLRALSGRVGAVAFDPNVRPRLWPDMETARRTVEAACAASDIVLPSDADGALLWGEPDAAAQARRYLSCGAGEVAITCGPHGAWMFGSEGALHVPARAGAVVDTAGAGDAFNGAYLAARLQGRSVRAAAEAGQELAAAVVAVSGALPALD